MTGIKKILLSGGLIGLALILGTGCGSANATRHTPDLIKVVSPDPQYGAATNGIKSVSVEVLTAPIRGHLGGLGSRRPVANQRLLIRALDPLCGLKPTPEEVITDQGGRASFEVHLGTTFGDQYLEISCADHSTVRRKLRFVSGVVLANNNQETSAGDRLVDPFSMTLVDASGAPIQGVPVYFSLLEHPGKGARIAPTMELTDENGMVAVQLETAPGISGVYRVGAEIADPQHGYTARLIGFQANALNISGLIVGVLGGLALFVYGMTLMSDGLQQIAGNRMKRILSLLTANRIRAIFAGAVVSGLIHSSSAMTVMTVGFVNAGLLTLKQAIGVIFGANIGTTVTGQMVSFNLSNLALPSITLGMLLLFVLKRPVGQGFARSLLGFGLLFFGMEMMSSQLKAVSEFPGFVRLFQAIDCQPAAFGAPMPFNMVLGAVGIGILTTVVVQSSAATIGLAIALSNSGLLNIWTAIPIVLGDNIGTTITAVLASLNASRTAKQAALAHTVFNVMGTLLALVAICYTVEGVPSLYYIVDLITRGDVFNGENVGRHVAAAHSLFNVLAVAIFTPFIGFFVWLCTRLIREQPSGAQKALVHLNLNWLATPSLALDGAVRTTADMCARACRVATIALGCYRSARPVPLEKLMEVEAQTDDMQRQIMDYLMQLTKRKLSLRQTEAVPVLIHCVSDAERIADIGVAIAELVSQSSVSARLIGSARHELGEIINKTRGMGVAVLRGLHSGAAADIEQAIRLEAQLRLLIKQAEEGHVARLHSGECAIERGIVYVEVLALIESIVRHLGNIATRTTLITNEVD